MSILINSAKCAELALPRPLKLHTCKGYVLYCITQGHTLNTRICRYIGINNLHSVISALKNMGISLTVRHEVVYDPNHKKIISHPVDVLSMTPEQREEYWANKKPAKA